ncbi:MAE_28990/MAE_18760 family HEPN-like nuclease [Brachybacterium sp. p3-SID957]|uniref:MAE_28990/MAE_18760 family HEPN-like nuclease n=1 Tax=Brachybacterium sp. p3-SID957 TaxID=2916049 RepID=UPI00223AED16|nr:MAE_28990/MAE_18760 family HEPN-like nuclease [Brachybacterium sp. p3-SID957]MCT1775493.1 MAE_28990/MAE_18760 family HEPN-like nuclease [Brachybacterium sp. p3-SID957]
MATTELAPFFDERYAEIEAYLSFLQNVEDAAREGAPRLRGTDAPITTDQKKILNSSLYLQLYNLVEATVLRCLEAVVLAIEEAERRPSELSIGLRTEWVRSIARTHSDLGPEKRLEAALDLCEQLLQQMPIRGFQIERGGGGNWDDSSIEKICERVGCGLVFSPSVAKAAKRHIRDDMGALKLVKNRRNGLAHGSLSFVDCSDGVTVSELQRVATAVGDYLKEAVACFVSFIEIEITKSEVQEEEEGVIAS